MTQTPPDPVPADAPPDRLRALTDAAPLLLGYIDADLRYRDLNLTYERWYGVAPAAVLGRRISEVMDPASYAAREPLMRRALAGESLRFVTPVRIGERVTPLETQYTPDRGDDGVVRGLFFAAEDVGAREAVLLELREAEARFRLIADTAPVPMWVTGPDGGREFVNAAYCELVRLPYAEALVLDWRELLHPDDLPRVGVLQADALRRDRPVTFEARFRPPGAADWIWLRADSKPRFDRDGRHVGFIGAAHDVTAAKAAVARAAEEVRTRTGERDRLWALSRELLVIADADGRWLAANPAIVAALGRSEAELTAAPPDAFVHPDDLEAARARRTAPHDGPPPTFENRLRTAGGDHRTLAWSAVTADGLTYASARDVTEERRREAELQAAQDQLQQSQKMEALGQLTGGIAHDFNNLLTPVTGGLDLLRRRTPPEDARTLRTLDTALQAAGRAATLVQRLLAFARRQDLRPRTVDVGALVEGMEDLLARSLGPEVTVAMAVDADLSARVDPGQLELALLNLCINGRDAMPDGGVVTLRAERCTIEADAEPIVGRATVASADPPPGDYVCVSVSDTGSGMNAATLKSAVEPFFSTKGLGRGTGLGLSMVHGLAAQSGGRLRLESAPGRGTRATLWLPAVAAEPADAAAAPRPAFHDAPAPPPPGAVLLVVDDEPLVREATAAMLADLGYAVVRAGSGPEALERLREGGRLDALVTDFVMPGMDGGRLAVEARRLRPALPVLLVTGYTAPAAADAALPRLAKPFRQAELAAAVADAVEAARRAEEVGPAAEGRRQSLARST